MQLPPSPSPVFRRDLAPAVRRFQGNRAFRLGGDLASETLFSQGSCSCCSPSRRRPLRRGAECPPCPSTTKSPARTWSGRNRNLRRRSCLRSRWRIRTGVESAAGASAIETSSSAAAICPSVWESKNAAAWRRSPGTASAATLTFACCAAAVRETSLQFCRTWEAEAAPRGLVRNSQEMAAVPGTGPAAAAAATLGGARAVVGDEG